MDRNTDLNDTPVELSVRAKAFNNLVQQKLGIEDILLLPVTVSIDGHSAIWHDIDPIEFTEEQILAAMNDIS